MPSSAATTASGETTIAASGPDLSANAAPNQDGETDAVREQACPTPPPSPSQSVATTATVPLDFGGGAVADDEPLEFLYDKIDVPVDESLAMEFAEHFAVFASRGTKVD